MWHYVRKTELRRARMKNGDVQIMYLHRCITHYRVIQDARYVECLPLEINLRCTIRVDVVGFIVG
jgi:hypothetical protein